MKPEIRYDNAAQKVKAIGGEAYEEKFGTKEIKIPIDKTDPMQATSPTSSSACARARSRTWTRKPEPGRWW